MSSILMKRFYQCGVFAIALGFLAFWADFIFSIRSGNYHSADDVNFFGPLISDFLRTGDKSLLMEPQGTHLHFFYKFQTSICMKYFGWSSYLTPLTGLITLSSIAFLFRHRSVEITPSSTGLLNSEISQDKSASKHIYYLTLLFFVNGVFVTALLGHINQISFSYQMLTLNNPIMLGSGALCLFGHAQLLTLDSKRNGLWFSVVLVSGFLFIWGLSTAFNYFLLMAVLAMSLAGLLDPFYKCLLLNDSQDSISIRVGKFVIKYKLSISAAISIFVFVLVYYLVTSSGRAPSQAQSPSIGWLSTLHAAYATTGLTAIPAQEFSVAKGVFALILILLSSVAVFASRTISHTIKLFFFGICVLIITFGLGVVWLRGESFLLAPRYAYVFSLFWIAVIWILGSSLLTRHLQLNEEKEVFGWVDQACACVAVSILFIFILLSVYAMHSGLKYNGSIRKFYAPRIHVALHTPLNELNDADIRKAISCTKSKDICLSNVLRMRCFANNLPENLCATGTTEQLRIAIEGLDT